MRVAAGLLAAAAHAAAALELQWMCPEFVSAASVRGERETRLGGTISRRSAFAVKLVVGTGPGDSRSDVLAALCGVNSSAASNDTAVSPSPLSIRTVSESPEAVEWDRVAAAASRHNSGLPWRCVTGGYWCGGSALTLSECGDGDVVGLELLPLGYRAPSGRSLLVNVTLSDAAAAAVGQQAGSCLVAVEEQPDDPYELSSIAVVGIAFGGTICVCFVVLWAAAVLQDRRRQQLVGQLNYGPWAAGAAAGGSSFSSDARHEAADVQYVADRSE